MNSTDNIQKSGLQQISQLSFSSGPNHSFQIQSHPFDSRQKSTSGCGFIVAFIVLGFYFLVFAIVELSTNYNELSYGFDLYRDGREYISDKKFVTFPQHTEISIYLEIDTLTQFDIALNNNKLDPVACLDYKTNFQMNKNTSLLLTQLDPLANSIPCGKYVSFYPQGNFEIIDLDTNDIVNISTNNLIFDDVQSQNINKSLQWADMETQRYKNWIVGDSTPKIKKLWGQISQVMSGMYQISMTLNNENIRLDSIKISLNNNGSLSGYNTQLCYINFTYAIIVFIAALAYFLIEKKWGQKKNLKKKIITIKPSNENMFSLNSGTSTPAKFY